jgi:hypothetical protein
MKPAIRFAKSRLLRMLLRAASVKKRDTMPPAFASASQPGMSLISCPV